MPYTPEPGDYNDRERWQHTRQSAECKLKYTTRKESWMSEERALGVVTGVEFPFFFHGVLEGTLPGHDF